MSERSRCGAVRFFYVADEPSAEIMRVRALSLWRHANLHAGRRTLCADRACRIVLAVAPCEFACWPTNPLRESCVSDRSRCSAVRICTLADKPFAGILRVESFSLWRRANLHAGRRTLCGDRICRSALVVTPCEFSISPTNPLWRSCASDRSRCGAVQIYMLADEPSARNVSTRYSAARICMLSDESFAGIVRVGSLSL